MIVHSALSSFGQVSGGAKAVVDALLVTFRRVMVPTFTYQTMIIPDSGPENNGLDYSRGRDSNRMAKYWSAEMPADKLMGVIPETLRTHRKAGRSMHPILSFSGVGVKELLGVQRMDAPFLPLAELAESGGWVLLLGVGHAVNTSLHYAEALAKRKVFTRWALTPDGVRVCDNFPGCSNGFVELEDTLAPITRQIRIGDALVRALPAAEMIQQARSAFEAKPDGYLCRRVDCGRCDAVRNSI